MIFYEKEELRNRLTTYSKIENNTINGQFEIKIIKNAVAFAVDSAVMICGIGFANILKKGAKQNV